MKAFRNILFFANAAGDHKTSLARAVSLAETNNARLTVMDAAVPAGEAELVKRRFNIDLNAAIRQRRLEQLEALTAPYADSGIMIYTQVPTGTPYIEVLRAVQRNKHDLLIKTAEGPLGVSQRLFGGTDMHLLRKCPCPVWIDRANNPNPYRTILAAVDPVHNRAGDLNRRILDLATLLAQREKAALHVVHAWRIEAEPLLANGHGRISQRELDMLKEETEHYHRELFGKLLAGYGIDVDGPTVHLRKGRPSAMIVGLARECAADLVVMGTVGRTGVRGLIMGNTAEYVLHDAQASVLAVKPKGFVSPIDDE